MKRFSVTAFIRSRYPWAMVAGLLLALSFPKTSFAGFAWVAPGLILAVALGTRGAQSFRVGYVAGFTHYLVSLNWLLHIPYRWHGIPFGPALGWLALSAFMALYPATWVWLCFKVSGFGFRVSSLTPRRDDGPIESDLLPPFPTWSRRARWAMACAALWVAMEMALGRVFGGFPWNLLGASQYRIVPLIQVASVTGVYGVSFIMVWSSVALLNAVLAILRRPTWRSVWIGDLILPMLAVMGVFAFGWQRLEHAAAPPPARHLKVTLIQPGIPQTLIWDPEKNLERFQEVIQLSERALETETDLLIWPEAALPGLFRIVHQSQSRFQPTLADAISNLARSHKTWIILGADDAEVTPTATNYFNASFLIDPEGTLAATYHKRSLVIFGEYVPLQRWLPFLNWFTPAGEGFKSGDRPVPFTLQRRTPGPPENNVSPDRAGRVKTSVLICFEDVFPYVAREAVEPDTDFLVNITNDGWFGEAAAQWQQTACAIFRAVENGLPLVRCANTGLTCWVDACGRLRQYFVDPAGSVYGKGFMTVEIPLSNPGAVRLPTFYHLHGDWFGWSCAGVGLAAVLLAAVRKNS